MKTKQSLYLMGGRLVSLIFGLFTYGYYIDFFGKPRYETILFAFTVMPFVSFVDLNFSIGAQKLMTEALHQGNDGEAYRIQRVQALLCWITSLVGFLVFVFLGCVLKRGASSREEMIFVFTMFGITFVTNVMTQLLTTVAVILNLLQKATIAQTIASVLMNMMLLWLGYTYHNLGVFAIGYAFGALVGFIVFYLAMRQSRRDLTSLRPLVDKSLLRQIMGLGARNVPNSIIGNLANRSDKLIIKQFVPITGVMGDYANSTKGVDMGFDMLKSIQMTITPEITRDLMTGHEQASKSLVKNGLLVWAIGCCLMIAPSGVGDAFIHLYTHGQGIASGGVIMAMIAFYYTAELHHLTLGSLFLGNGTPHKLIGFSVFNAVLTLSLTLPMYHWLGLSGVAYMNAGIMAAQFIPRLWVCKKELTASFPLVNYALRCVGMLGVGIAVCLVLRWLTPMMPKPIIALLLAPIGMVVALAIVFGLKLSPMPNALVNRLRR